MSEIAIVALGAVGERAISSVGECLWRVFGFGVRVLDPLPDPAYAFDAKRSQYSSTLLLSELLSHAPPGAARILGVTERDLFIPMLSFVYGHAQFKGRAAVVSLARLRQEFYRLPAQEGPFLRRAATEAVHEIGHTFGLTHCPDPGCAMSLSNTIHQVDRKSEDLCGGCSLLLEELLSAGHLPTRTSNWRTDNENALEHPGR